MENNSQAIELKGIVRNQTKIGVQDGQCDDIVNLRFKDGSWRVADDGKSVYNMTGGYSQLYVHTNVYHHLLGVRDSKLWWFANIEADNETFVDLDSPVEICEVKGNIVSITQNGHLLTIITKEESGDGEYQSRMSYSIYKHTTKEYKILKVSANGEQYDRTLFPYGRFHLNLDSDYAEERVFKSEDPEAGEIIMDSDHSFNQNDSGVLVPKEDESTTKAAAMVWHSNMMDAFNKAKEANSFTSPFLAVVAVKLYDGSYLYATNPILLNPRERFNNYKNYYLPTEDGDGVKSSASAEYLYYQYDGALIDNDKVIESPLGNDVYGHKTTSILYCKEENKKITSTNLLPPNYQSGAYGVYYKERGMVHYVTGIRRCLRSIVVGSDLLITFGDLSLTAENRDVFQGISLFVTKESSIYDMSVDGHKKGTVAMFNFAGITKQEGLPEETGTIIGNVMYKPPIRSDEEVARDLMHSPFYLLREWTVSELQSMSNTTTKVDLSSLEYKGVLANIEQQTILNAEAFRRDEPIPEFAYQYNQKLHIANYKSKQFHGYPIDYFQLSNYNLKIKEDSYAVNGTLPNVKEGANFQYPRTKLFFAENEFSSCDEDYIDKYIIATKTQGTCFASIAVTIDTQQGEQQVCRYILPYNSNSINTSGSLLDEAAFQNGDLANFVEDLNPLLTFPDGRASKMLIRFVYLKDGYIVARDKEFKLKPHPYLNLAYYLNDELKPINITLFRFKSTILSNNSNVELFIAGDTSPYKHHEEKNSTEVFPNGLKVSLANNPFIFPYETTYQVGSSEIVALMSNAVAVGTGQTGAAPLFVFCKDGIYALMVNSSGEMTYTNARIIARDVCNNAKSVTPIDSGVVFTTDRGLMSIAGSEVVEIGSAAEGDVFYINDTFDKAKKIMFNAFTMEQLAELPQSLVDNTDFLTYIKGAIVNYNHNERELMVSNPNKDYTYVMDSNGNWGRRAFTAQEYVNNYPTSYRVDNAGNFYKVDTDDNDTNKVYLLSNVIKLGTIAFKQTYRLVVRGYFETDNDSALGIYVFSSSSGNKWKLVGGNEKSGKFSDIGCKVSHEDIRFLRVCLAGKLSKDTRIDYIEVSADGSALNGKLR